MGFYTLFGLLRDFLIGSSIDVIPRLIFRKIYMNNGQPAQAAGNSQENVTVNSA